MALISVIVPCYNVERYIDRCMHSLVKQTIGISNLEIILVNDASTDGTLNKLQCWEEKYPENIMVVTYEKNIRQGGARNIGMQYATSEYIGFVDADDYVALDMYEVLYSKGKNKPFDMIFGMMHKVFLNEEEVAYEKESKVQWVKEYQFDYNGKWYEAKKDNMPVTGSVCTGIYLRNIIVDNNIWFPENIAYEDNYWINIVRLYVKNMCEIGKLVYYYCINENSTVQKRNELYHLDRLDIEIMIVEKYKEIGAFDYYREYLKNNFIRRFYLNSLHMIFTRFDYVPDVFNFMKEKVLEYFPDYNINNGNDDTMSVALIGLLGVDRELTLNDLENVKRNYLNLME